MADSAVPSRAPSAFPAAACRRRSQALSLTFVVLLSLLLCLFTPSFVVAQPSGLVRRDGGRFALDDSSTFHVTGGNCYWLAYSLAAEQGSFELEWVDEVLDEAQRLSLNVLRVWAFQVGGTSGTCKLLGVLPHPDSISHSPCARAIHPHPRRVVHAPTPPCGRR